MQAIIDKARAMWAALKAEWDKRFGTKKDDSGGGGGPGPVR